MVKKLDDKQKRDILVMFQYKFNVRDIADRMDVSDGLVRTVIKQYRLGSSGEAVEIRPKEKKVKKFYDRHHSKYGFAEMEVGNNRVIEGVFYKVRMASYWTRRKWGTMFLVTDLGEGMVKIERYK